MIAYLVLLIAVGLERLAELVVSKRNLRWSLARGGVEVGAGHYPAMVALHSLLLIGCAVEVLTLHRPFVPVLGWPMFGLVVAGQALRWWCIRTLGRQWNTRIVITPGLPLVRSGPYRLMRHPNYLAVVVEGVALPLVHTAWLTATIFAVCNAALLRVRLRAENAALATVSG
jgi:methyltransferase